MQGIHQSGTTSAPHLGCCVYLHQFSGIIIEEWNNCKEQDTDEIEFSIFKFLFKHKPVEVGKDTSLERDDFNNTYFKGSWMTVYDNNGDGCTIHFPITAKLKLKWSALCYDRQEDGKIVQKKRTFKEHLQLFLVKVRV